MFFDKPAESSLSTAQSLANWLKAKGINQAEICHEHLMPIYSALPPMHGGVKQNLLVKRSKDIFKHPLPSNTKSLSEALVWGLIIETRPHPALPFVLENFSKIPDIPIQLVCSMEVIAHLKSSLAWKLVDEGRVIVTLLSSDQLSTDRYNSMLVSQAFWEGVIGQHKILLFQTDAVYCTNSDFSLADFTKFDYIGARWPRHRPTGIIADGGNGGLSLRDKRVMMDCLERFSPSAWRAGEDGYYTFHLDVTGAHIARGDECSRFASQSEFKYRSLGAHKPWLLDEQSLSAFLKYCPEAAQIITAREHL